MKTVALDLSTTFKNLDGGLMLDENNKPVDLGEVIRVACASELRDDTINGAPHAIQTKMLNWDIYIKVNNYKVHQHGLFELSEKEAEHLKPRVAMLFPMLVAVPVLKLLDNLKIKDEVSAG